MPSRTIRTIGASLVLIGLVVAAFVQWREQPAEATTQIQATETTLAGAGPSTTGVPDAAPPFVYRIGVLSGISTDNFWAYYGEEPSVWNSYILGPTKPALFSVDPTSGNVVPELATSMSSPTWDADGWRVRVELNPSFRWSDGEPVTADDFAFTFDTVRALELGGSWSAAFPDTIESVHADGEHTLRIEFTERPDLAVWPNGVGLAPVMPAHVWHDVATGSDLYAASGENDVSGGPLELMAVGPDVITSRANAGYPVYHAPDTVEYHVYGSEADMAAAVAAGEIDTAISPNGLSLDQLGTLEDTPGVSVLASPANSVRYLGFNLTRAPMSDKAFRTALALLVDREHLAESLSVGEPAWSLLPAANTKWFDETAAGENAARYQGEPADRLARALTELKAAGYAWANEPRVGEDGAIVAGDGLTIGGVTPQPLTILVPGDNYDPAGPAYVDAIAAALGSLGFDARPVETDFDTVVDLAFTPGADGLLHYDMYVLGWTLGSPALPEYYRPLFATDGEMNNTGYTSKAFDAALAEYEGAFTVDQARAALWAMEKTLSEDLPYLPLYNSRLNEVYRSDHVGYDVGESLGGLQARLGGIADVRPGEG